MSTTATLTELFDRHAKLVIDHWTYHNNPTLRDFADRIFALAGITATDVKKEGVEVYRTYAVITAFDRTADGVRIIQDGKHAHRLVVVDLATRETR